MPWATMLSECLLFYQTVRVLFSLPPTLFRLELPLLTLTET
jgi:hypothetical protein